MFVHGVSLSSRGSGRLDTRLDTPPISYRHHPVSRIAPVSFDWVIEEIDHCSPPHGYVDPDDALDRHTKVQRSTVQQPFGPLTSRHPIVAGYCKGVWLRAISRATMPAATNIYRSLMFEIERRRLALGFPMEKFSEFAGLSDRYYSKALFADEPSGRQAQWSTLEVMVQALFPHGYDLELRAKPGAVID